ncbi:MAG: protein jag, partial [Acidimicrobiales bacterium]
PEPTAGGSTMTELSGDTEPTTTPRLGTDDDSAASEGRPTVEVAEVFLEGLLDAFGLVGTLERLPVDEDSVELAVVGDDLGLLIGPKGQTLAAVQELTRAVIQRRGEPSGTRVFVDVAGYRQARRAALDRFTREAAQQVLDSGITRVLEPMPAADRKVVHDTVNTLTGLVTMSEGEDPHRRVVIMLEQDQG